MLKNLSHSALWGSGSCSLEARHLWDLSGRKCCKVGVGSQKDGGGTFVFHEQASKLPACLPLRARVPLVMVRSRRGEEPVLRFPTMGRAENLELGPRSGFCLLAFASSFPPPAVFTPPASLNYPLVFSGIFLLGDQLGCHLLVLPS